MKDKIFALLTAKFPGTRKDALLQLARSLALQFADEKDAKEFVDKLTDAQVNDYTKEFRADVDKEVSSSIKKNEENLRKKFEFVDKKDVEPGNEPKNGENKNNDPNDIAAIVANAVATAVKPLQERLQKFETGNLAETRLRSLNEKLATCKDDAFKQQTLKDFARMQFDSDDAFNEYLTDKAKDIEGVNQRVSDDALRNGSEKPLFAQTNSDGVSSEVQAFIDAKKPETNKFAGKEV